MTGMSNGIFASALDLKWHLDPVAGSHAGIRDHDARYGRFSEQGLQPHLAALQAMINALESASVESLDEEIDRTALLNDLRVTWWRFVRERQHTRNPHFFVVHALDGIHALLMRPDDDGRRRAAAVQGRLQDLPSFLDDAEATLREPIAPLVDAAIASVQGAWPLFSEVEAHWPELRADITAARRALEAFAAHVRALDPGENSGCGVGERSLHFRLHYEHGVQATSADLWRFGCALAEEVRADLSARARSLGAGWPDVMFRLGAERVTDTLATYRNEVDRAQSFVEERRLASVPEVPLDVVETPEFLRPLIPTAAYDPAAANGEVGPGRFLVTPDLTPHCQGTGLQSCRHAIPGTALHEGVPGHHLQFARTRGLGSDVRRNVRTLCTVEGWALYCEEMMREEGFFETPAQEFFQRIGLLLRAARVLLDVAVHARGIEFAQAVAMLRDRIPVDEAVAEAEVRRCCALPGQQLSYAVGRRELLALRSAFRARRAPGLLAFHDAVLHYGALPISLIRWGLQLN